MARRARDEIDTHKAADKDKEEDYYRLQLTELYQFAQREEMPVTTGSCCSNQFGSVLSTASNTTQYSSDFWATANFGSQAGVTTTSATWRGMTLREVGAKCDETSRHAEVCGKSFD